ncbi:hypothetical protein AB0J90_26260 [Micromonospora sp. NPDC049523]|uniref:hypothetical protein n=1 Tax=Micromonospora sp. NPDC049523 TaxID=3155921 RepID=UPI00341634B0
MDHERKRLVSRIVIGSLGVMVLLASGLSLFGNKDFGELDFLLVILLAIALATSMKAGWLSSPPASEQQGSEE